MAVLWIIAAVVVASLLGHGVHWAIHQPWMGPAYRGHLEHHVDLYPPGRLISRRYKRAAWYHSGTFLFAPPLVLVGVVAYLAGATTAFIVTLIVFAVANDWMHDSMHILPNRLERFRWFRRMRGAHFQHHRRMGTNFGIVTLVWDDVFGTRSAR